MKGNEGLRDIFVAEKPQDIRLIYSEKHNMILRLVMENELSISDIAKKLNLNPGSVHYHLKELEKHGLVKQVREEIKGGIVKKYYRSTARRILLDSPNYNMREQVNFTARDQTDRIIKSIEYLGYHLPPENREDAEEMLARYDKRMRDLLLEMQTTGIDSLEENGSILHKVYDLILNIRAKDDPELGRIYREFEKLFLRYE